MPGRGGKTPGAGRKKGIPNKTNKQFREMAAALGLMPLVYALEVMRNKKVPRADRLEACKVAIPYLHSRMPIAITHQGNPQQPIQHQHRMIHEVKDITPQQAAKLYEDTLNTRVEFKPKLIAAK
jgi:hypothetical protein